MKRILVLLLCFSLLFTLAGCGKEDTASAPEGLDVEYYANLGQMPECEYKLGDDVDNALAEMKALEDSEHSEEDEDEAGHSHEGFFVTEMEDEDYSSLQTGTFSYYYKTDAKDKGFTHIVSFDKAYGFEYGTVSIEIKDALSARGLETAERDITSDEAFFMPGAYGCTALEYNFENTTVMFIFQDNLLCATALFTTDI